MTTPVPMTTPPPVTTAAGTTDPTASLGIVLVDDQVVVRQGLRAVLEREDDLRVVGETSSVADVLGLVERSGPDVVLLDLNPSSVVRDLDGTGGLAVCAALTSRFPGLGVLVLAALPDDRLVLSAIRSGARGYVVKDVDSAELVRAIRAVGRGGSALDTRSTAAVVGSLAPGTLGPVLARPRLTEREVEVLRLLAQGFSNRMIGSRLYISETTVKFHVSNLMRKLEVSRRAEAVYTASKLGYI